MDECGALDKAEARPSGPVSPIAFFRTVNSLQVGTEAYPNNYQGSQHSHVLSQHGRKGCADVVITPDEAGKAGQAGTSALSSVLKELTSWVGKPCLPQVIRLPIPKDKTRRTHGG